MSDLDLDPTADVTDPGASCPDCGQPMLATTASTTHESTCPYLRAFDLVVAADRAWFLAHPQATAYHRPPSPVEVVEWLALSWGITDVPDGHSVAGRVTVARVSPDVRARMYGRIRLVCDHDQDGR